MANQGTMPRIKMAVQLFLTPTDVARSRKALTWLMFGLVRVNEGFIRAYPGTPLLYESGVIYKAEPRGQENWQDIPTLLEKRSGDCEDLACYRCAELQASGINAMPFITWRVEPDGSRIFHALLKWPDGRVEDPSRALGMLGEYRRRPVFIDAVEIDEGF